MQIYVNDQELDAELTGEQTLQEVYQAVSNWIAGHKRYILSLRVDGAEASLSGLPALPMQRVERLDFYVGDELDMVLTTVGELDRYIDQVGMTLFEQNELSPADIANLAEGVQWIAQILNSLSGLVRLDLAQMNVLVPGVSGSESIDRVMERLDKRVQRFSEENDRAAIEDFLGDLRSLKFFVMKLFLQLRTMNARLDELADHLARFEQRVPEIVAEIVSINESFNAGKDFTALETLDRITGELNEYVASLYALDVHLRKNRGQSIQDIEIASVSFQSAAAELTQMLRDLSDALEENDIIAAGDILEYELAQKLGEFRPYLTEIRQFVLAHES